MKKNSFNYLTILIIIFCGISISFKPIEENSVKVNSANKFCIASIECDNNKSFVINGTIMGTSGSGTSVNFRYSAPDNSSVTKQITDVSGSICHGVTGINGQLQSTTGVLWTGSVDIYGRTGSGNSFIKTVVFSTPQFTQNFTFDGVLWCYGYTLVVH